MSCGIYRIRNLGSGHAYIGSAVIIKKRWSDHKWRLHCGVHHSPYLQRAWDKYGEDQFVFEIVELTNRELLIQREQFYIDTEHPVYNISKIAGRPAGMKGKKHTEEAKRKISESNKGKHDIGFPKSEETRRKISEANKGNQNCLGRHHSPETVEKIRNAQKGKPRRYLIGKTLSEERKKKISEGNKRYRRSLESPITHSEETKAKMRVSHTRRIEQEKAVGFKRTRSAESREQMRQSRLRYAKDHPTDTRASHEAQTRNSYVFASSLIPVIEDIRDNGAITWTDIARELNNRGVGTRKKARWSVTTVKKLLERIQQISNGLS